MNLFEFLKYSLKRIFNKFFVFGLIITSLGFVASGTISSFSKMSKMQVASIALSEASKDASDGETTIFVTFPDLNGRSDFQDVYYACSYFKNAKGALINYDSYCGLFSTPGSPFSDHYKIECSDFYPISANSGVSLLISLANSLNKTGETYVHEFWGLETIFSPDDLNGIGTPNPVFLPSEAADYYLKSKFNIDNPSVDDYRSLLGEQIAFSFTDKDNSVTTYVNATIRNIFAKSDKATYFFDLFGPFVCGYSFSPFYKYGGFSLSFSRSVYQNGIYVKKMISQADDLGPHLYSVSANDNSGLINNENINELIKSYVDSSHFSFLEIFIFALPGLFFGIVCFWLFGRRVSEAFFFFGYVFGTLFLSSTLFFALGKLILLNYVSWLYLLIGWFVFTALCALHLLFDKNLKKERMCDVIKI